MSIRTNHGGLADFAPALILLFAVTVFPTINGIGLAIGYVDAFLLSTHWASLAAAAPAIEDATQNISQDSSANMSGGLARVISLHIVRQDLYVIRTQIASGKVEYIGPRERAAPPLNTTDFVYEYLVRTHFAQEPFVTMAGIPFLANVPGLGSSVYYVVCQTRYTEHIDGLVISPLLVALSPIHHAAEAYGIGAWKPGWPK